MTKVYARKHGGSYLLTAKGHAAGSTEVCAAVSGLLYALAGYLANCGDVVQDVHVKLESADAELRFCGSDEAEAVFTLTVVGLMQIEAGNPDFITVDFKEL